MVGDECRALVAAAGDGRLEYCDLMRRVEEPLAAHNVKLGGT